VNVERPTIPSVVRNSWWCPESELSKAETVNQRTPDIRPQEVDVDHVPSLSELLSRIDAVEEVRDTSPSSPSATTTSVTSLVLRGRGGDEPRATGNVKRSGAFSQLSLPSMRDNFSATQVDELDHEMSVAASLSSEAPVWSFTNRVGVDVGDVRGMREAYVANVELFENSSLRHCAPQTVERGSALVRRTRLDQNNPHLAIEKVPKAPKTDVEQREDVRSDSGKLSAILHAQRQLASIHEQPFGSAGLPGLGCPSGLGGFSLGLEPQLSVTSALRSSVLHVADQTLSGERQVRSRRIPTELVPDTLEDESEDGFGCSTSAERSLRCPTLDFVFCTSNCFCEEWKCPARGA